MGAPRTVPFVGRRQELDQLERFLRDALRGRLRVAFVQGEAGIGKSRLVAEALAVAELLGFDVFSGRCDDLERARPFGPLVDAFGCLAGSPDPARAAIADRLARAQPDDAAPAAVREAFADLVEEAALRRPVMLLIEDLHWSDRGTLTTIRTFARRLPYVPLAVVATNRPVPLVPELDRLEAMLHDDGIAFRIALPPLGPKDVAEIAASRLDAEPASSLLEMLGGTAGNPLFILELLDMLERDGSITRADGRVGLSDTGAPPSLPVAILRRISHVSEPSIRMLRLAAILGSTFGPADLSTLSGEPLTALAPLMEECVRAGILQEHGQVLRFRHDAIRDAVYQDLPEPVRSGLHLEAARKLVDAGADAAHVAQHYAIAARPGDREAVATLREAAVAARTSPGTRVELLERALALTEAADPEHDEISAELAAAHVWGGSPDAAALLARQVCDRHWEDELGRRLRPVLLRALRFGARWQELVEIVRRWQERGGLDAEEEGILLSEESMARAFMRDYPLALERGNEALALGERIASARVIFQACYALCAAYGILSDSREGIAARRAYDLAERNPDFMLDHPRLMLGMALLDEGRTAEGEATFFEVARRRQELGTTWETPVYHGFLARWLESVGRSDEALVEAEVAIAGAAETGSYQALAMAHMTAAGVLLRRADLEGAEAHLTAAEDVIAARGPQWGDVARLRWLMTWSQGDLDAAFAQASKWLAAQTIVVRPDFWVHTVELYAEARPADAPRRNLRTLESLLGRAGNPAYDGVEAVGAAVAAGDDETLARMLAEPLPEHVSATMLRHLLAAVLARKGRTDEAKAHARAALSAYEAEGDRLRATLLAAEMGRRGVRIRRTHGGRRPMSGWESLTETERRIAALAAEGLTNPSIARRLTISPRTVQTHLAHIFAKLGISSRVELAAETARRARLE